MISKVICHVLHTAHRGDTIDIELSILPVLDGLSDSPIETEKTHFQNRRGSYMMDIEAGHIRCAFQINHYFSQSGTSNLLTVTDSSSARRLPP